MVEADEYLVLGSHGRPSAYIPLPVSDICSSTSSELIIQKKNILFYYYPSAGLALFWEPKCFESWNKSSTNFGLVVVGSDENYMLRVRKTLTIFEGNGRESSPPALGQTKARSFVEFFEF